MLRVIWKNAGSSHSSALVHSIIFTWYKKAMQNTGYYTKLPGGNSQEGDEGLLQRGKTLKWGISETDRHIGYLQPTVHDLQRIAAKNQLSQSQHHSIARILICLLQFPRAGKLPAEVPSTIWIGIEKEARRASLNFSFFFLYILGEIPLRTHCFKITDLIEQRCFQCIVKHA